MYINRVFKLKMVLDTNEFDRVLSKHTLLESDGDEYIDPSLAYKGITVRYRDSQYKKKVSLIVNSALVLKGKEHDTHKLVHKLEKRIGEYFGGQYSLENFKLAGLTLTTDINVGSKYAVAAYIRVIQRIGRVKGFSPAHYEGFDKHSSFCMDGNSNGISFFLYDLRTAAENHLNSELLPDDRKAILRDSKGILRADIHLTALKAIRAYFDKTDTASQIIDLTEKSEEIFMSIFAQIIPDGDFYKKGDAVDVVRQRVKNIHLQRKMLRLIGLIPEKKSLLLAQKAMSYREPDKLLAAFADIGLSPVTISKRMNAEYLPSLYSYMSCNNTNKEVKENG